MSGFWRLVICSVNTGRRYGGTGHVSKATHSRKKYSLECPDQENDEHYDYENQIQAVRFNWRRCDRAALQASEDDVPAVILLHELGHVVGTFPHDTDQTVNDAKTQAVIHHCFKPIPLPR